MADNNQSGHVDDYTFSTKAGIVEWLDAVIKEDELAGYPIESSVEDFCYEFDTSSGDEPNETEHKGSNSDPAKTESDPDKTESAISSKETDSDSNRTKSVPGSMRTNVGGYKTKSAPKPQEADKSPAETSNEEVRNVTHEPDSLEGMVHLQRIRQYFMMPNSYTFERICQLLENNGDVIRHLATYTIPHPDQYLPGEADDLLFEPRRGASRKQAADSILYDIRSIIWGSDAIQAQLDIVYDTENKSDNIWSFEQLRKHRHFKRTQRAVAHLRATDLRWKAMDDAAKERRKRQLDEHSASRLNNEVRFDSGSNKRRGGDDAEVSGASKRSRG